MDKNNSIGIRGGVKLDEYLKLFLCLCLVVAVIISALVIYQKLKTQMSKKMDSKITESFTYTAHTGCLNTKDNSLDAIDVGVKNGADIIEFDLNFNKQNQPVLSHDEPKGGEFTLDEAFERVSRYDGLCVNVDVKKIGDLSRVEELAKKHGILDRIFFTGVTKKDAAAVKKACPDVDYYLNVNVVKPIRQSDEYLKKLVEEVKASGAVGINFNKDNATEKLVETFHENGLLVSIWTVNKEKDIYRILSYGPDNITTRRPDLLKLVLKR